MNAALKKLEADGYSLSAAKHLLAYMTDGKDNPSEDVRLRKEVIKSVDATVLNNLGMLFVKEFKSFKTAEQYFRMAIDKGSICAMEKLGLLYELELKDFGKAEQYFKKAIDRGCSAAMNDIASLYQKEFKDFTRAEQYYKMAIDKGDAEAMNNLAYFYFQRKEDKQEALDLIKSAFDKMKEDFIAHSYMAVLLWNDDILEAIKLFESFFDSAELQREVNEPISDVLLMFMAKRQLNYVYKVFQRNNYDIRDKYKPIYYALLSLMGKKYADELKKMGDELTESVQDVLSAIKKWEKAFA